ncbi:MAG: hypothetical protein K8L91_09845 [Anaerolineae bacterium]|nr:hypothetical protein [Anaerolineae bacterium]
MSDPNPKTKATPKDDDAQCVSPTSDDTLSERYAKVRGKEADMTSAELLETLRSTRSLFDEEAQTIRA